MPTEERVRKITSSAMKRQEGIIVLENIHDPHNAEAVIRSCDAFGIQKVCFITEIEKKFDPRSIGKSSSSSANKWIDFIFFETAEECFKELKSEGYEIWATVLSDKCVDLFEADLTVNKKIAFALGNENRGLSETAIKMADKNLIIPMAGMVQSLNLSVTASICMFELTRQRKVAGIDKYLLAEDTRKGLINDFLERKLRLKN